MKFIHKSFCLCFYTLNHFPEFDTLPEYEETRIVSSKKKKKTLILQVVEFYNTYGLNSFYQNRKTHSFYDRG